MVLQRAHGDAVAYPIANNVKLEVQGVAVTIEAAVSETLSQSVLLGTGQRRWTGSYKGNKISGSEVTAGTSIRIKRFY